MRTLAVGLGLVCALSRPFAVAQTGWEVWSDTEGGANADYGYGVAIDSRTNVIVVGCVKRAPLTGEDQGLNLYMVKYDAQGQALWTNEIDYARRYSYDMLNDVAVDGDDNIVVAGTVGGDYDNGPELYWQGWYVAKFGPGGNLVWAKTFGAGEPWGGADGICVGPGNEIFVCGHAFTDWSKRNQWVVYKLDTNGIPRAGFPFYVDFANGPTSQHEDIAEAIAADEDGNFYVAGHRGGPTNTYNGDRVLWHVRKYNAERSLVWEDSIGGGAAGDYATAGGVVVNEDGDIYAAGYFTASGVTKGLVVSYHPPNGARLWTNVLQTVSNASETCWDVAVDRSQHAIAVGSFAAAGGGSQLRLTQLERNSGVALSDVTWPVASAGTLYGVSCLDGHIGVCGYRDVGLAAPNPELFVGLLSAYHARGTVSYTGAQTGLVFLAVFDNPLWVGDPVDYAAIPAPGPYDLAFFGSRTGYVVSVMMTTQRQDGEIWLRPTDPWGAYGGGAAPLPVVVGGSTHHVDNVDFALFDGTPSNRNPIVSARRRFDFDGDYRSDPCLRVPSTGQIRVLRSGDGAIMKFTPASSNWIDAVADYDGDGLADFAWYEPRPLAAARWHILESSHGYAERTPMPKVGGANDTPLPADYDGDGRADPAVFLASSGRMTALLSESGAKLTSPIGNPAWIPVPGDYDGDGVADFAWCVRKTSLPSKWRILESSHAYAERLPQPQFGKATDVPLSGDFDGDGQIDLAVFRTASGVIRFRESGSGNVCTSPIGGATWRPAVGDYDDDGRDDCAWFRPDNGLWKIVGSDADNSAMSNNWTAVRGPFGKSRDRPCAMPRRGW